jgi:hypothetical protein
MQLLAGGEPHQEQISVIRQENTTTAITIACIDANLPSYLDRVRLIWVEPKRAYGAIVSVETNEKEIICWRT